MEKIKIEHSDDISVIEHFLTKERARVISKDLFDRYTRQVSGFKKTEAIEWAINTHAQTQLEVVGCTLLVESFITWLRDHGLPLAVKVAMEQMFENMGGEA